MKVAHVGADTCDVKILRQWQPIAPGCWAVERSKYLHALTFYSLLPTTDDFYNLGFRFHVSPLSLFDWGADLRLIRMADSFDDNDWGIGFGGFGMWKFLRRPKMNWGLKLGLAADIPFKEDHKNNIVNTMLFSTQVGCAVSIAISSATDLAIEAGYRFGTKSDRWEYTAEEESYDAFWRAEWPEVKNSGLIFSIGLKFYAF